MTKPIDHFVDLNKKATDEAKAQAFEHAVRELSHTISTLETTGLADGILLGLRDCLDEIEGILTGTFTPDN